MPRKVALLAALACSLAFAAPASAAITPSTDAAGVAGAIADPLPAGSFGASWDSAPGGNAAAIGSAPGLARFATSGATYGLLSSGDATLADDPNSAENTSTDTVADEGSIQDLVRLRIDLAVPQGQSCLTVDFRFLSEEFAEFVGGDVNDAFVAQLDDNELSGDGNTVNAPGNFAFDGGGNLISVNTALFSAEEAAGTTYDGATPLLRAATPITPGPHSIYLSIFDQGDSEYDSTVFLDALRLQAATCQPGAVVVDVTSPAVTLTAPGNGSTLTAAPVYSGAGEDGSPVTVQTFAGAAASGAAVQSLTVTPSGGAWSVAGGALAPGTYTAVASQSDAAGNFGSSTPVTFNVAQPPPPVDEGPPPPVTGKAVNVAVVKGKVRIRRPGGKFVLLGDASQIPTGSTIDTRNGTVALTSTGAGGKLQKANFFDGLFKVTQTRGKKPLTNLTLNEKLAKCPKKKASKKAKSSAKKKRKRRLWGDGKGNFRTSGRRSAATVSGTRWLVEDTCKGTLTRVSRGKVKVRDFRKKKTVTVKAGKRYLAK